MSEAIFMKSLLTLVLKRVVRKLAFHWCGKGLDPGLGNSVKRGFIRALHFFSLLKTNISKFQFDPDYYKYRASLWMCYQWYNFINFLCNFIEFYGMIFFSFIFRQIPSKPAQLWGFANPSRRRSLLRNLPWALYRWRKTSCLQNLKKPSSSQSLTRLLLSACSASLWWLNSRPCLAKMQHK